MSEINVHKGRSISPEGAVPIGHGFTADVYLIGEDTVVKVLKTGTPEDAEKEILLSKWALKKGIPTAISFDVVDFNGHPGLVYECLGRNNLRNELRDHPESFEPWMRSYNELLRAVGAARDEEQSLPEILSEFYELLGNIRDILTDAEADRMKSLLDTVPRSDNLVHGDCHVKNIKLMKDTLFLIDLETLSRGDPIFELSALYRCYKAFPELKGLTELEPFFELPVATTVAILDRTIELYFEGVSPEALLRNRRKIALISYMFMIDWARSFMPENTSGLDRMCESFRSLLYTVDDLRLEY